MTLVSQVYLCLRQTSLLKRVSSEENQMGENIPYKGTQVSEILKGFYTLKNATTQWEEAK